jgi:hypothetical protein
VRALQADPLCSEGQRHVLKLMERTFGCYIMEGAAPRAIKAELMELETELEGSRQQMKLGYTDPASGEFKAGSSVLLRNKMRTSSDEAERKACYEGLRAIGPFVAERFVAIVKRRNQLARALGHEDFYAYKVLMAEGFSKQRLFGILDGLEATTRPLMQVALGLNANQRIPTR